MSILSRLAAHLLLSPLVGTAFLHGRPGSVAPAGLELLSPTGEKFRTTEAVNVATEVDVAVFGVLPVLFVGSGGPVEIPLERDGFPDQVREALKLFSQVRATRGAVISQIPAQRWNESDLLDGYRFASIGPVPYKRYMALSFVDDAFDDVIHTGSPAAPEKLPAWEANARVVLAGAKRWAQQRWSRS